MKTYFAHRSCQNTSIIAIWVPLCGSSICTIFANASTWMGLALSILASKEMTEGSWNRSKESIPLSEKHQSTAGCRMKNNPSPTNISKAFATSNKIFRRIKGRKKRTSHANPSQRQGRYKEIINCLRSIYHNQFKTGAKSLESR